MNDKELTAVKQALQEYVNADNSPLEVNPRKRAAIAALEQHPSDEPVGQVTEEKQVVFDDDGCVRGQYSKKVITSGAYTLPHGTKLYTRPQPAAWVGLTDEELDQLFPAIAMYHEANKTLYRSIARAIEAKLREKNENK